MKKALILCITLLILLTGCGKGDSMKDAGKQIDFQQISMQEGLELMGSHTDYILLDVRKIDEFEEGHIPGTSDGTVEKSHYNWDRQHMFIKNLMEKQYM